MLKELAAANSIYITERIMNLRMVEEGKEYIIDCIETNDEELDAFLFSLGCYSGEPITVIAKRRGGMTVSIKDGRYNIDNQLAEVIFVK
jgi:ferrous iron transport protein A